MAPVSPAVQMRWALERARANGVPFDEAWDEALRPGDRGGRGLIDWPHEKEHRDQWKILLGAPPFEDHREGRRMKEAWRRAYEGMDPRASETRLTSLVAA